MFWPIQRNKKTRKRVSKARRRSARSLRVESLEPRVVLSGIVEVELSGDTLYLTGDQPMIEDGEPMPSDNWVEVAAGDSTTHFVVTAKDNTLLRDGGSLKLSTDVYGVKHIVVQLGQMSDTFELKGDEPTGTEPGYKDGHALVRSVYIENDACGTDKNIIDNVLIKNDLNVERVEGTLGRSVLEITDSTIEGSVFVYNGDSSSGGSTSTTLIRVEIDQQLTIHNGDDQDFVTIQDCRIDMGTQAGTFIWNGDGGSRTTFISTGATGNVLYGPLYIYCGANPVDVPGLPQLDDFTSFHNTEVKGNVFIDSDTGDSRVLVDDGSNLGSNINLTNQGDPVGLVVRNGEGFDMFDMSSSTVLFGIDIDNAYDDAVPDWHTSGSLTTIFDSTIGKCINDNFAIQVLGDDGEDTVQVTETVFNNGEVILKLFDGNNNVLLEENSQIQGLTISTYRMYDPLYPSPHGSHRDVVVITGLSETERQEIMFAKIELGDGRDDLIMTHVSLLGDTLLDGDLGLGNPLYADGDDTLTKVDVVHELGALNEINWENW